MPSPIINRRDLDFVLHELLDVASLTRAARFAEHSRETFDAAIDAALAIAADEFAPHNRVSDENEPRFDGERVTLIPEVGRALKAHADAGLLAACFDEAQGGMQLPSVIANACWCLCKGANIATETYATLTIGVANMLSVFGTEAQKARYLPGLLDGRFFGTMVLTEPQAGSSLAEIRSTATPLPDGRFSIKGHKVFITGGDHEMGENIVHLVLARLPDAPPGVKGISLFVVPKYRAKGGGRIRNDVSLAGLIHKMGCRGATSTMLNFGERGDCIGELLGPPHSGLACMFQMMNEARINVGMASSMLAYAGYLQSLAYARERMQGRATPDPRAPQVAIVRHADVRRMLLAQKCVAEGGLALCLQAAMLHDQQHVAPTAQEREQSRQLLDLLTPIVKAWLAKHGTEANSLAVQIHGGYGYTREYAVEQLLRDNRLNSIHEGTDGIQALDLLGRKVASAAAMDALDALVDRSIQQAKVSGDAELVAHSAQLHAAWADLRRTTQALLDAMHHDPNVALANASAYLEAFGTTVMAWMWLRQATLAARSLDADPRFYRGKLAATRYFFGHELPRAAPLHALLRSLDRSLLDLDDDCL